MPGSTQLLAAGLVLCAALASSPAPSRAANADAPKQAPALRSDPARAPALQRITHAEWLAQRAELRDIESRGRESVAALLERMQGLPAGAERRALEAAARQAKLETRVRFLAAIARFARTRGDAATAREAERQIDLYTNPPRAMAPAGTPQPAEKPAPGKRGRP